MLAHQLRLGEGLAHQRQLLAAAVGELLLVLAHKVDKRRRHTRFTHQIGVVERLVVLPVGHPREALEALQHGARHHAFPLFVQLKCGFLQGLGDALVEHGQGPDQAGCTARTLLRGLALSDFNPAAEHRAYVIHVALVGGTGTHHQRVHFLIVGVAFEQVGHLAPQDQLRDRVFLTVFAGDAADLTSPAVAGEVEQVDLFNDFRVRGFNQPKGHFRRQRRQLGDRQGVGVLQAAVGERTHFDRQILRAAEALQDVDAHDAVAAAVFLALTLHQHRQRREHGGGHAQAVQ